MTTLPVVQGGLLGAMDLVDDHLAPPGSWRRRAAERLVATLGSRTEPFPCVFGVDALRRGGLRFAFVDAADTDAGAARLATALRQFVAAFPALPKRCSLVTFLDVPAYETVAAYQEVFWRTLTRLHEMDDVEWPAGIATDPEDPWWEFSFAGMPMFVVCATAAHAVRRSRAAEGMVITFQPRPVFDGLEPDSRAGRQARVVVRGRLATYDAVPPHPALGAYGDPGYREWRQYFLPDAGEPGPDRCPFEHARAAAALPAEPAGTAVPPAQKRGDRP